MWRWSSVLLQIKGWQKVFSTYVEVIPISRYENGLSFRILHVCGGDPVCFKYVGIWRKYSPRMWRWSHSLRLQSSCSRVFSTYVEVILAIKLQWIATCCILHVCGGDPESITLSCSFFGYSPRMWRWSQQRDWSEYCVAVFSTYVEVIPWSLISFAVSRSILHVCGGDPYTVERAILRRLVFSTYVEVILASSNDVKAFSSILHVCGGDPLIDRIL